MSFSSGLIRGCFGAALGFKIEENKKGLRIYGFEGEAGGRGGCGRASANQNVAGASPSVPVAHVPPLRWPRTLRARPLLTFVCCVCLACSFERRRKPVPRHHRDRPHQSRTPSCCSTTLCHSSLPPSQYLAGRDMPGCERTGSLTTGRTTTGRTTTGRATTSRDAHADSRRTHESP